MLLNKYRFYQRRQIWGNIDGRAVTVQGSPSATSNYVWATSIGQRIGEVFNWVFIPFGPSFFSDVTDGKVKYQVVDGTAISQIVLIDRLIMHTSLLTVFARDRF